MKMHLFKFQKDQEHSEWFRADVFLKTDDLPNHLILWPCLAAILPGTLKCVVEGWTCSSSPILSYQPSQLSAERLPSTEQWLEASGHRLRGPGEEAPLICNSEMQRHSGKRCFVSSFVCTHGFHFDKHSTAVDPCNGAQWLRHFFIGLCRALEIKHISESEIFIYILNPKHRRNLKKNIEILLVDRRNVEMSHQF